MNPILLKIDSEIFQILFKPILRGKAGVAEIAFFICPLVQSSVIKQLQIIVDDKRHDIVAQTFLEQNQPSDSAVSVLERVDALELIVKIQQLVKALFRLRVVIGKELFHFVRNLLGQSGCLAADLIRALLVFSNCEPILAAVARSAFQCEVKLLDKVFIQLAACVVDHHVNALEVVSRFNDVIHIDRRVFYADRIGLKDIARLIVCKPGFRRVARLLFLLSILSEAERYAWKALVLCADYWHSREYTTSFPE